jgi:hypothetical protein
MAGPATTVVKRLRSQATKTQSRQRALSGRSAKRGVRREQVHVPVGIRLNPGVPVEVPDEWQHTADFKRLVVRLRWVRAEFIPDADDSAPKASPVKKSRKRNKGGN